MIRLFQVYYPVRTLVLFGGEALVIALSFLLATLLLSGHDWSLVLSYENGLVKILILTTLALLCSHYFDLYEGHRLTLKGELYVRLLVVLGVFSIQLAIIDYLFPNIAPYRGVLILGMFILTLMMLAWRTSYAWLLRQSYLRERVYVLGGGSRAKRLVEALRQRSDLGMDVVGWDGATSDGLLSREMVGEVLAASPRRRGIDRIIVALGERRGQMPLRELLSMRLQGVKVEDATTLLERISGKIDVDELHPSWLIFSGGFRLNPVFMALRRVVSLTVSLIMLLCCLPLIPFIILAIKLDSAGPVLFKQQRVGRNGVLFNLYKFRTMRQDAEAESGPAWASDDDPRATRMGRFLRRSRLDEIPQLWNVLKGDMGFVGPRPERPEFVQWLADSIPYYHLRHIIRPGITGWAQINYPYGASLEDANEKLQYDLYYIKNMALFLDLLIIFRTVKTVLWARGSR